MASVTIVPASYCNNKNEWGEEVAFTALATSDKYFEFGGKDCDSTILVLGSGSCTLTIEVGDTDRAAAETLTLSVASGKYYAIQVDSGYYGIYGNTAASAVTGHFGAGEKVPVLAIKASAANASVAVVETK